MASTHRRSSSIGERCQADAELAADFLDWGATFSLVRANAICCSVNFDFFIG